MNIIIVLGSSIWLIEAVNNQCLDNLHVGFTVHVVTFLWMNFNWFSKE